MTTNSNQPLWQLSACELAQNISSGHTTATAAVTAAVDRMRASNGQLNAVVDDLGAQAIAQAGKHDKLFKSSGPIGLLHGVPVTVKENIDQKGCATPNGVSAFRDVIAPDDSPVVRNLKQAGAIIIGRTNTPEFSFRGTTSNELHGRTYSPWNDWATSGGSSGGASTAVMAGMGAMAHGNDIAGSLRYPAAATGSATVKPGLGRVPAFNPSAGAERGMLAQVMSVQGIIAREVKDVRLGMKALINYDAHDPWMVEMPFDGPTIEGPIKVGFTKNTLDHALHPAVSTALDDARAMLTDAGYLLEEIEPPMLRELADDGLRSLFGEVLMLMVDDVRQHGSKTINQIFDDYFEVFPPFEGKDLLLAMARRSRYTRAWLLKLQEYPLILTPFLPTPTYAWDRDTQGLEGVREVLGGGLYSYTMNFMGLPAGNIAASYNDGLPIGIQIVGRRFREDMILDACEAIEQRAGIMANKLFDKMA